VEHIFNRKKEQKEKNYLIFPFSKREEYFIRYSRKYFSLFAIKNPDNGIKTSTWKNIRAKTISLLSAYLSRFATTEQKYFFGNFRSSNANERVRVRKEERQNIIRKAPYHLGHLGLILASYKEILIKFLHRFRARMNKRVWRECVRLVEDSLPRMTNDGYGWGDFCISGSRHIFPFYGASLLPSLLHGVPTFLPRAQSFYFLRRVLQLSLCRRHFFRLSTMWKRVEHNFSDNNIATGERNEIKGFNIYYVII